MVKMNMRTSESLRLEAQIFQDLSEYKYVSVLFCVQIRDKSTIETSNLIQ